MASDTGVALIQTILRFAGGHKGLVVDGLIGNQTRKAYANTAPLIIKQVQRTIKAATGQNSDDLVKPVAEKKSQDNFSDVAAALAARATAAGLLPSAVVAQVAHESGWGTSGLSRNHRNYGGLKFQAVRRYPGRKPGSTTMKTKEFIDGVEIEISDGFATFESVDHFADVYVWYLLDSGSSWRYKGLDSAKTGRDFFTILKDGGYATDPTYVDKLVAVHSSVRRRYPNIA